MSLQEILTSRARGRGVRGGASRLKGLRDDRGRRAGEGGRNSDRTRRPCGEYYKGTRMKAARKTIAEQACGGRRQEHREQVSSDVKGEEFCARCGGQEGSGNESVEWSSTDLEEFEGSETEEEATTTGGTGWESKTRTATAWGTQESGADQLHGEARASRATL